MQRATRGNYFAASALWTVVIVCCSNAPAAITDVALYELGEPGTIIGGNPQDSVGGHHFLKVFGNAPTVVTPGAFFGSTTAANYGGDGNFFAAVGTTTIPTDNFAIEVWARTSNTTQTNISMFTSGAPGGIPDGALALNLDSGQWRASRFNQTFFGTGVPVIADEWVNLALIRDSGQTTFYVDGIAQGAADAVVPIIDVATFHIGVNPGGSTAFNGDLDNLRIFTFDPNTDDPVAALTVNQTVPEPASIALWTLLGMAAIGLAWRKRNRASRS